jgi:hypothetical protein
MRVSREHLLYIREQIEIHTLADPNITDVIITYQVKETEGSKNFLKIEI